MRWAAAFTTHPGRRSENQDAFLSAHPFYGVFDGHGADGLRVSSKARDLFQEIGFARLSEVKANPEKTLRQIFVDVHEAIVDDKSMDTYLAGTTACIAYLDNHSITVAHVGDSKALLVYDMAVMPDGGLPYRLLAAEHTPINKTEMERVVACGARVERLEDEDNKPEGPLRVFKGSLPYPGLAMTRSIGDTVASKLGVTAEPDVFRVDIDETILCIVLATDGVWDSLSPEKVVDIITRYPPDEAQNATEKLLEESLKGLEKRKIDDNTTNGVIYFDHE